MDYFGEVDHDASIADSAPLQVVTSPDLEENTGVPVQGMRASHENALSTRNLRTRYSEALTFDWTRLPMSAALPRHIQFVKSVNWAATPLGPMKGI